MTTNVEEANRITNGEMSLLLAPYDEMIGAYFGRRLWKKEKRKTITENVKSGFHKWLFK